MKRWIALVTILALVLVLSVGCSAKPQTSSKPESAATTVEIEYWQYHFDTKVNLMNELIKEFEGQNPGIKVKHVTFPYEQFNEKVAASVPAGQGPDVVNLFYGWLPKYVEAGYLQPLPKDAFPPEQLEKEFSPVIKSSKLKGEYWSIPIAVRTLALIWNKDIFKAANLDPERPPKTLDELVEMAKKTTKRDPSGKLEIEGFAFNVDGQGHNWFREVLLPQFGVQPLSDDARKVLWNSKPEGYQAFEWWIDLARKHKVGEIGFYENDSKAFLTGHAAMTVDGSFRLGSLATSKINFGVAPLPTRTPDGKKVTFASYWTNAITKKATGAKKEAAIKFLKFITSEETMRKWVEKVGEIPARIKVAQDPTYLNDPKLGPFISQLPYGEATFLVDEKGIRQAIIDAVDQVLLKNVDPKKALDEATAKAQKLYDEFWARQK